MAELRWNPLLGTWTMVASSRQDRPQMPKDFCPFCPGSGKVPENYDVLKYDNDFPVLSQTPDPVSSGPFHKKEEAYGRSEVILYSPDHHATLQDLPVDHIRKVVDLWMARMTAMAADPKIQYVFPFENKGEEVGVTMPHPHGQIYAFPYVPLKLRVELQHSRDHHRKNGECLICRTLREEAADGQRVIHENAHFAAVVPFFTDYPYGVFIISREHRPSLLDLTPDERQSLAEMLKIVTGTFEKVYDRPFPFMMVVHQTPVNCPEFADSRDYFHFHIEFYPPLRDRDKIKFYASSEMGAWACANVAAVEESSITLRKSKLRYLSKWDESRFRVEFVREFLDAFGGTDNELRVYRAPGRVNLIGEHTDYNGGLVFPAALDLSVFIALRPRTDSRVMIRDLNLSEPAGFSTAEGLEDREKTSWLNYPKGVWNELVKRGLGRDRGCDALVFSEIPPGSGLSSSAALELAFAYGANDLFGLGISPKDLALLSQSAENSFVGVQCGVMDQFSSVFGRRDCALLLDCATLDIQYVPLHLGEYRIVIANTNKKRSLSDSKYNERRSECERGLADLRKKLEIPSLGALDIAAFQKNIGLIRDTVIQKRVRHVVTENERVRLAAEALQNGDLEEFGKLMVRSHESLRDDYEVTGPALDVLFDAAKHFDGCLGTRMTGAGFGGCTVSLVHKNRVEDFKTEVGRDYNARSRLTAAFYVSGAGNGAGRIE